MRARDVTVAFRTLGCKVNQVESEDVAADLLGRGVRVTPEDEAAVVVINTCTVTGEADAKARKAVRHALGAESRPLVVVTGCLATLDPDALRALGDRVIVEADKSLVAARVAELLEVASHPDSEAAAVETPGTAAPARIGAGFHTRVQLKVEDGCDAFCTYCIVPYARGVPRATPLAALVAETERLVGQGAREIVLTGINIGRYRDGAADLADVIASLAATGVPRIRLSSIEPLDLDARLLGVMAETPAFCPHLHVPLQAGDDGVLAAMGRGYTVAEFSRRVEAARAALPGVAITTDVLAGFPGETETQAATTLGACEALGFTRLHVFRYSARPGTPAAAMPDQVEPAARAARARDLRALSSRLQRADAEGRRGQGAEMLVETVRDQAGGAVAEGTTREYVRVRVDGAGLAEGDLVDVVLGDYHDGVVDAQRERRA